MGSYSETLTSRSAERSSGGSAPRPTSPANSTRPVTSRDSASFASLRYAMSPRSLARGGPPATTSSAPGTLDIACSSVASASCSCRSATVTSRCRPVRSATGPSGLNSSVSTPQGTTRIDRRGTPSLVRSDSSSELPATTALTLRPIAGSSRMRSVPTLSRQHVVPALGDAKGVERLHDRDAQVAGGGQGGEAAGPAQRVHHVGALVAPPLVQRLAERGHLGEQFGLVARVLVAGPMYSTVTPGSSSASVRRRGAVPPRVHGHPMALAGQAPAQFAQPWRRLLGDRRMGVCWATRAIFMDGPPRRGSHHGVPSGGCGSGRKIVGRASTHADDWRGTCLRRRHH